MAAVVPPQNEKFNGAYLRHALRRRPKPIRPITALPARTRRAAAKPSQSPSGCSRAPRWSIRCAPTNTISEFQRFDLAVDWGWFIFLTQPLFWLLDKLYRYLGNFGLAISGDGGDPACSLPAGERLLQDR